MNIEQWKKDPLPKNHIRFVLEKRDYKKNVSVAKLYIPGVGAKKQNRFR